MNSALITAGLGGHLVTIGMGGITVIQPPVVVQPQVERGLGVPIYIHESTFELGIYIFHSETILTSLPIRIFHSLLLGKKLGFSISRPPEELIPVIVKHINILIKGGIRSIQSSMKSIEIESNIGVVRVENEESTS